MRAEIERWRDKKKGAGAYQLRPYFCLKVLVQNAIIVQDLPYPHAPSLLKCSRKRSVVERSDSIRSMGFEKDLGWNGR